VKEIERKPERITPSS